MSDNHFLCQIRAAAEKSDEAEILVYDDIGRSWFGDGITAKQFVKDLSALKASLITVRINSAGGDVFEGLAIHNALKRHDALVVTEIDGLAASIASIIALAGEEVRMADNAFFMIHNPMGMAMGDASVMREYAELLDKVGGSLANVYAEKTGKDREEIEDWMNAETWFDAEEAKAAGFVDKLVKGKKIEARADLSGFKHAPRALVAMARTEEIKPDAAGGAAPDPKNAPNQPADEAMEGTMSGLDAAAQAAALETARTEERQRVSEIRALAREHSIPQDQIDKWIDDGTATVARVKDEVLAHIKAAAKAAPNVRARVGAPRAEKDPRAGFESHTDFLTAVLASAGAGARASLKDERLRPLAVEDEEGPGMAFMLPRGFAPRSIVATAGSDEQGNYADTYGGFLKPVQVQPGLLQLAFEGDPTEGLTTKVPMAAPIVKWNARVDKNHTSSVSGGLTFTRTPETAAATPSRMSFEQITLEAQMLVGAAYATEQVMTDSPISFAAMLSTGFVAQRAAHMLNEKIRGLGGAEYTGVLGAPCEVHVAKETNQVMATIVYDNILKMRARCWGYGQAVWIANHDTLPQLAKLSLAIGTGGSAVFVPGQFGSTPDVLLGRPILFTEYASTLGDYGDFFLVNWSQYLEGIYQPMRSDESIHVRFLNLERTFRFYERNCGAPWWRSALTVTKGSNSLSPIVSLNERA